MEVVPLVSAAAATWAATWAALGGDVGPRRAGALVRGLGVRACLALGALGRTRVAAWLAAGPLAGCARVLRLAAAARGLSLDGPSAAAGACVAGLACAALLAVATGTWAVPAAVAGLVAMGVGMRRASAESRRRAEVVASMPGVYRTLSAALGAGQTLAQAVEYVGAHVRGPAGEAFGRMSLKLRCGVGTEEAVRGLAGELEAPGTGLMATALVISHRTGSPLRGLLTSCARLVERQGDFERMLAVKTAQVRLSARIVCVLPLAMVGLLALLSPDFRTGLASPAGLACACLALVLDAVAALVIRGLMGGVV